jgi:predicted DNA-binding antitoxin AbrB/MazE fold protein
MTVRAFFEDGVFKPIDPVGLPEHAEVEFEPRLVSDSQSREAAKDRIFEILDERFDSGDRNGAQRHNEHQP